MNDNVVLVEGNGSFRPTPADRLENALSAECRPESCDASSLTVRMSRASPVVRGIRYLHGKIIPRIGNA